MIRSSSILALAICLLVLCGFGIHAGLARMWGPGPFGDYIVVITILVWMEIIINMGVPTAVSKLIAEDGENESSILKTSLSLQMKTGAGLLILLVLLSPLFGKMMGQQGMTFYLLVAAADIPFMGLYALYHKALSGRHRFGRQAITIAAYASSRLLAILGLAALGFGIWGALVGNIIGSVAGWTAGFLLLGARGSAPGCESRTVTEIAKPTALYWLSFHLLIGLDLICIRAMIHDPATAGYYGAALTLARIPYFALAALNLTIVPLVARALKTGMREQASAYVGQAVMLLAVLLFIGIALVLSTSRELVALVYSSAFTDRAAPSLNILVFAFGLLCLFMVLSSTLVGAGHAKKATRMSLFLIPGALILNLLFIPLWGPEGAATATLIMALAAALIAVKVTAKIMPIPVDAPRLIKALLASAAIYFISVWWHAGGALLLLKYLLLLSAYFTILLLTKALSPEEIRALVKKER